MPRVARLTPPGFAYHVLNRSVGRMKMFRRDEDFAAFERVMIEAHERQRIRILAYCLMPTHWHFVVWPSVEGQLTDFFRWMTHTHAMRWRASRRTLGYGHLYQGRFKSFPIQRDEHLLTVCRYVERNALTAGLVKRAEHWQWGSLWVRASGPEAQRALLSDWPVAQPARWAELVNTPLTDQELERMRSSVRGGRPFGEDHWVRQTAQRLHLDHTLRPRGRPRKVSPIIQA